MPYSKQELLDWITEELPEDAVVTFIAVEVGEEAAIDDLIMPVEGGDLNDEELKCYGVEEETSHIIFIA